MKKTKIFVLALLCQIFNAQAQNAEQHIAALKVGDKVPASFWMHTVKTMNQRGEVSLLPLSNLKGKAILVDFWAVWCGSCILKFNDVNTLQKEFADSLTILPVNTLSTRDKQERMLRVMSGEAYPKIQLQPPSVIEDQIITQYFPHLGIPYYVWIDKQGRVKAITQAFLLNKANIKALIN